MCDWSTAESGEFAPFCVCHMLSLGALCLVFCSLGMVRKFHLWASCDAVWLCTRPGPVPKRHAAVLKMCMTKHLLCLQFRGMRDACISKALPCTLHFRVRPNFRSESQTGAATPIRQRATVMTWTAQICVKTRHSRVSEYLVSFKKIHAQPPHHFVDPEIDISFRTPLSTHTKLW
jgi:hypothetical protein